MRISARLIWWGDRRNEAKLSGGKVRKTILDVNGTVLYKSLKNLFANSAIA